MKKTLFLSFLIGLTIQALIAGFLGKLEEITISSQQQFEAAGALVIIAAILTLAAVVFDLDILAIQVFEFLGMTVQALVSGILIDAGVRDLANYQFQLNLGIAYLLIAIALAWEWRGQLRTP